MPPAWRATTRGPPSTGWSLAAPSAGCRCTITAPVWIATPPDALDPGQRVVLSEQNQKGQIKVGQLADLAVLSKDYFRVPEEEIMGIESVLTVVNGDIVYAAGSFGPLAPPPFRFFPSGPRW